MTTPAPLEPYSLCGTGEYRLVEAIVDRLLDEPRLVGMTNEGDTSLHENTGYKIGAGWPGSRERTPFVSVVVLDSAPLVPENPNVGWQKSVVMISGHSRDQIVATLLIDWVVRMLTNFDNRGFLDFTNNYVRNSSTKYLSRDGLIFSKTRENEGKDTWHSSVEIEVIWLDSPCDGDCIEVTQEVCDDETDCSTDCE